MCKVKQFQFSKVKPAAEAMETRLRKNPAARRLAVSI